MEAPGTRPRKALHGKRKRAAAEAEKLLEQAPAGLAAFYHALTDAFPGYHGRLAKLMVKRLQLAGVNTFSSSSDSSSDSSSSAKRKKKKRKKKKKKKEKKKRKKEKKALEATPEAAGPA